MRIKTKKGWIVICPIDEHEIMVNGTHYDHDKYKNGIRVQAIEIDGKKFISEDVIRGLLLEQQNELKHYDELCSYTMTEVYEHAVELLQQILEE